MRPDTGGASHIPFIVRDDAGRSDLLFQTSDTTWQAYNSYGGDSLYKGDGPATGDVAAGRAYKVSYNRPFNTRLGIELASYLFDPEYPMIRWLEANGYNVSYASGMDTDRKGSAALTSHKIFLSVGHDEYWSAGQRANVEAARAAGVHLGFFSGNEIFWKTRWENSIAGTSTAYRTLVCYKETHANAKIDPTSTWTGTWRDPRFTPPAVDGGKPENAVSGQFFTVNAFRNDPIQVPANQGKLRFWRNTGLSSLLDGQSAFLPAGVLGYEWDEVLENGFEPYGRIRLSNTTLPVNAYIQDYGNTYAAGIATHNMSLYRHSSGALVFGAGTCQWSWGLDSNHDVIYNVVPPVPDPRMQQATVNLLADMGAQPTTLQGGLVSASASSDLSPPSSILVGPPLPTTVPAWSSPINIFGIAADAGGGQVAGVELSIDGGTTWHSAAGTNNWAATWTPGAPGSVTLQSRAIDDSVRAEVPSSSLAITVTGNSSRCTLWPPETVPPNPDLADPTPVELGVRFNSDYAGWITALRFYKSAADVGTHIGNLWSSSGTLLATVTFTNETPSGWQEMRLPTPIAVSAGTSYIASYHTASGHHPGEVQYFSQSGVDRGPLHSPKDSSTASNGRYLYGASAFPSQSAQAANYWVDIVYSYSNTPDTTPPYVIATSPTVYGGAKASPTVSVDVQFNEPMNAGSFSAASFFLKDSLGNSVPAALTYDSTVRTARLQPTTALSLNAAYTVTVKGGSTGVADLAGNTLKNDLVWSFATTGWTLWSSDTAPTLIDTGDTTPVELGVRFKTDVAGFITALRYYKSPTDNGPHVGNLWSANGTLLASVNYSNETASGWQQANLPLPVSVVGGTSYVASYHSISNHAGDVSYFAQSGVDRGPIHSPKDSSAGPNGLYLYGASAFPANSAASANYWADIEFSTTNQAAAPVCLPLAGTFPTAQSVLLTDTTPGAQIYYTTNGATPTSASASYTGPIAVSATSTIKAIAIAPGGTASAVTSATYVIQALQVLQPTFNPGAGTYSNNQSLTISSGTPNATIYYTTNGATPTTSSTRYTAPIAINAPTTVKAIATASALPNSLVATANFAFTTAAPTFDQSPGTYTSVQSVTLSDASAGAKIYYTTDGTAPTTSSALYTGAISVSATTTINAIAAVASWTNSSVSSATYTIQLPSKPAAPASLAATASSPTQVDLVWSDAATNETGYKIERKTTATGTYAQIATAAPNATTCSDTTASASTVYYYRVRATNGGGDSAYSNEVSVTTPAPGAPPSPWVQADIGSTGVAGSGTYASGSFTIKGSGADIWNTADAFRFVYQPLNGDGEIVARVASVQNTDPWAKAGVMVRDTTAAGARNAFMAVSSGNGLTFQRRLTTGGSSTYNAGAVVTAPYWVRLVRSGSTLTGYASSNGSSWTLIASDTVTMGTTVQIGLAVTSHNNSVSCTAVIDNVVITSAVAAPSGLNAVASSSSQVNLSWTDNATNETGFKIERKLGASGTYAQIATTGAGVTSYADSGLTSGTLYYYRVRASGSAADSAYSAEVSVTTLTNPPAAPGGVTASTVSSSQLNLSWTDVATETGFKIERKTGATGAYVQIATVGANVTSYSDSGLTVNTTYYYRLRATNAGGDSPYSVEASATTLNTAPAAPSNLSASPVSTAQINLAWVSNSTNETGFRIERSVGTSFVEITTVGAGITAFSDTGLVAGTNYSYRVRATNALGNSGYSNQVSASTLPLPPAAPANLAAATVSSVQVNLTWSDVATETGFKIERKTGASGTYAQIATVGAAVTSYSNTGLTGGTTYYYRIRATNSGGDSAYSNEANATTQAGPPLAPATLTASASSGTQVDLTWSDVTNETGFKIERKTGAAGTYAQVATTGANVTSYSNTGLAAGTIYYFRVRATNAAGDSSYSPEASATTLLPAFRAAASAGATSGVLSLTINKPSGTVLGDVMIAAIAIRPNTAAITASGWTLIRRVDNSSGNANSLAIYYKVAGASEPASYAFTFSASTGAVGGIRSFSGIDSTNPIDVEAGQNTASSLNLAAPSVTTRFANDILVTTHAFSSSSTFTPPSGMTEAFDVKSDATGSGGEAMEGNFALQPAIAATGAKTATAANDADTGNAHTLALKAK